MLSNPREVYLHKFIICTQDVFDNLNGFERGLDRCDLELAFEHRVFEVFLIGVDARLSCVSRERTREQRRGEEDGPR